MAIYNEYRPNKFSEILGQDKVVKTFKGMLKTGKIPNAFLFVGERGTGKTSSARLWARWLNCENPTEDGPCNCCPSCREALNDNSMDVIELDAASNNGVADIHKVLDLAEYAPVRKRKVIVLDEVHMLSQSAFNVLLKPFEEGSNAFFILCTTEEHKIPAAITSRCSKFVFERISDDVITGQLKAICDNKGVSYEMPALEIISRAAKGGMRDSQSILEQFLTNGDITEASVKEVLGITDEKNIWNILKNVVLGDMTGAITALRSEQAKGRSMSKLVKDLQAALITATAYLEGDAIKGTSEYLTGLKEFTASVKNVKVLIPLIEEISSIVQTVKGNEDISLSLQAVIATHSLECKEDMELIKRIEALEKTVENLKAEPVKESVQEVEQPKTEPQAAEQVTETEEKPVEKPVVNTADETDGFITDTVSFEALGLALDEVLDEVKEETPTPNVETTDAEDGFVKGQAMSLDEIMDDIESSESEGTPPTNEHTEENAEAAAPAVNLFGSLFGGLA